MPGYLSVPYAVSLTKPSAWTCTDERRGDYHIVRFHYALHERQLKDGDIKIGERIFAQYLEDAQMVEKVSSVEVEVQTLDLRATLRESLLSEETVDEVAQTLGATIGQGGPAQLTAGVKSHLSDRIFASIRDQETLQHSVTRREKKTLKITEQYGPSKEPRVNAATYDRWAVDVYLIWIDYLTITYEKRAMGLRKRRIKSPPFQQGRRTRSNELVLNLPLGSYLYWHLLPSAWSVRESNYELQVEDPGDVSRVALERKPPRCSLANFQVPSLYQLSNAAFPLKWVKRTGPWTEEELMEIELHEAQDTVWWFRHGPGRRSAA